MFQRGTRAARLAQLSASALVARSQHVAVLPAAARLACPGSDLCAERVLYPQSVRRYRRGDTAGHLLARQAALRSPCRANRRRPLRCQCLQRALRAGGSQLLALSASGDSVFRLFYRVAPPARGEESHWIYPRERSRRVRAFLRAASLGGTLAGLDMAGTP